MLIARDKSTGCERQLASKLTICGFFCLLGGGLVLVYTVIYIPMFIGLFLVSLFAIVSQYNAEGEPLVAVFLVLIPIATLATSALAVRGGVSILRGQNFRAAVLGAICCGIEFLILLLSLTVIFPFIGADFIVSLGNIAFCIFCFIYALASIWVLGIIWKSKDEFTNEKQEPLKCRE